MTVCVFSKQNHCRRHLPACVPTPGRGSFPAPLSVKPIRNSFGRVAPDTVSVALTGDGTLRKDGGCWVADLPGGAKTRHLISRADPASLAALGENLHGIARPG